VPRSQTPPARYSRQARAKAAASGTMVLPGGQVPQREAGRAALHDLPAGRYAQVAPRSAVCRRVLRGATSLL